MSDYRHFRVHPLSPALGTEISGIGLESLAFRDNRCVRHHPTSDYRGHRREMHRLTLARSRPY